MMRDQEPVEIQVERPRPGLVLLFLFVGLLLLLSLLQDRGLLQIYHMTRVKAHLEREVATLKEENALLRKEVEGFRRSPSWTEEIARRDLGFALPGEIVYQFPPSPPSQ